ncbi:MAG: T9SS type A sorting domain-containing protein [Flavobacteriales bacterium]
MYPKLMEFMNTKVIPLGHLGDSDDWDTGYFLQCDGGVDCEGGLFDGPRLGEAVYMHYKEEDQEKAFGILMNRSWNLATTTTLPSRFPLGSSGAENYGEAVALWDNQNVQLAPFNELSTNEGPAIKLKNMGGCNKFEIKYFDPYTLAEISTAEDNTSTGGNTMKLKDFPALTFERPYILFTVTRIGDCVPGGNGMQEQEDDLTAGQAETRDTSAQQPVEIAESIIVVPTVAKEPVTQCNVSPNPASTIVTLSCEKQWKRIDLFNSMSEQIAINLVSGNSLNFSALPSGQYYLRVTFDELVETFKIVKL